MLLLLLLLLCRLCSLLRLQLRLCRRLRCLLWMLIGDLLENANIFEIVTELQHHRIEAIRGRVDAAVALQR